MAGQSLKGFKEFQAKLGKLPKVLKKEVSIELQDAALNWTQRAQKDAPVDQNRLRSEIRPVKTKETVFEVISAAEYSPYMEWGTGSRVKVPAELSSYAQQFKGKGTGSAEDAIKMLIEWVKRKGVRFDSAGTFKSGKKAGQNKQLSHEDTAYIIFHFIMLKGVRPHPFFFIQKPVVEKELFANIKRILETEH